jgi:hypothetical protein
MPEGHIDSIDDKLETVHRTPIQVTWLHPWQSGQARQSPHPPPFSVYSYFVTNLGENLTLASNSRLEVIILTMDGCGDHFGLYFVSVRGQAA